MLISTAETARAETREKAAMKSIMKLVEKRTKNECTGEKKRCLFSSLIHQE
jgi:hypothetical protein